MPCFTIGLDLGQTRDPSVLAIVERVEATTGYMRRNVFGDEREALTDHHFVRYLQRFEIGTSYTKVVEEVGRLLDTAELRGCTTLRFDATGVGRAVADMFKDAYRLGKMGDRWPQAVTLTAGRESNGLNFAKVDLVGALQRVLQERRLHIPESLPGAQKLRQELTDFTAKISTGGRDSYEAATEAAHDDMVVAVGLTVTQPVRAGLPRLLGAGGDIADAAELGW